jgi:outer membrane protein assembly factor BamA
MRYVGALPLVSVVLICGLLCPLGTYGQIPERLRRCLPYPTLADEIQVMKREVELKETASVSQRKTAKINSVIFDGPTSLPDSTREKLITELKQREFDAESDWIKEVTDVLVRGKWQDEGYFRVNATAEAKVVGGDSTKQYVELAVHVDEGPQFFLGHLAFRSPKSGETLAFTDEELRKRVLLKEGDIFSAEKIRKSLEQLRQLYSSRGYLEFTAEPSFQVGDSHRVNLTLTLDQQKQFRIGKVEARGLDAATEDALKSKMRPEEVFDSALLSQFFEDNRSRLPADASPADVTMNRNAKDGTVDLVLNLFTCPQFQN